MDRYKNLLQLPFLSSRDLAMIVWAAERVKPISSLQFKRMNKSELDVLRAALCDYGLFSVHRITSMEFLQNTAHYISIGLDPDAAMKEVGLDPPYQPRTREHLSWQYGHAYGYPMTAIQGYVERKLVDEESVLPFVMDDAEIHCYLSIKPFRLSESHWHDEAEVLRIWMQVLKEAAPSVFTAIAEEKLFAATWEWPRAATER